MDKTVEVGAWYEYKGNKYRVTSKEKAKMKIGQVWLPCVCYEAENDNKTYYVRELNDFLEKFRLVRTF